MPTDNLLKEYQKKQKKISQWYKKLPNTVFRVTGFLPSLRQMGWIKIQKKKEDKWSVYI